MPRISTKNQITIPVRALAEAGLQPGDEVLIDASSEGELVVRRSDSTISSPFGALTGVYPPDYLDQLDAEDAKR